ncbi:MAG: SRPBCC family protein [Gemmatimonadales bacterium]
MRPINSTLIGHVAASADRVFSLLTDPATIPSWLPGCAWAETTGGGPMRKGAHLKVRFGQRTTDFEVVDFSPYSTFGWVERGQRQGAKTFFLLQNTAGATAITIKNVWQPQSLGAWVRGKLFPKRNVKRVMDGTVNNLRMLVLRKN